VIDITAVEDAAKAGGITTLEGILMGAIGVLFAALGATAKYAAKLHEKYGERIDAVYEKRVSDLRRLSSKTADLEDVTIKSTTKFRGKKNEHQD